MRRWAIAIAASVALLAAGCSTASSGSSGSSGTGGTVTFALPAGIIPTYISPFVSGPVSNNVDLFQFTPFMWRPLYWFGINGTPNINYQQSMAGAPSLLKRREDRNRLLEPQVHLVRREASDQSRRRALAQHP